MVNNLLKLHRNTQPARAYGPPAPAANRAAHPGGQDQNHSAQK